MIIAIASNSNDIKGNIDPLFGRCNWFCIYESESKNISFEKNHVNQNKENAGKDAADMLVAKEINIVIAGRFGSKASDVFRKNNIQMVIPQNQPTIEEFINQIK